MGNLYTFFFIKNSPLFAIGTKNIHLVITYESILNISFILMMITIMNQVFPYMKVMMICFYLACLISHLFIFFINPGIPSPEHYYKKYIKSEKFLRLDLAERKKFFACEICNILVKSDEKVEHCEECDICVEKYDHHCFWTGKCIAKNNFWAFNVFAFGSVVYILWYFITIFTWLVIRMQMAVEKGRKKI